jgi:hypothetical protein
VPTFGGRSSTRCRDFAARGSSRARTFFASAPTAGPRSYSEWLGEESSKSDDRSVGNGVHGLAVPEVQDEPAIDDCHRERDEPQQLPADGNGPSGQRRHVLAVPAEVRRTCARSLASASSQQLLQSALPDRLVGADRNAITPAMNLLDRDPVRGRWFSHLNLELGPRRDGFVPTTLFQRRDSQRCSFVDGFGGHVDRVPDSRWGREADSAGPGAFTGGQRSIFAVW